MEPRAHLLSLADPAETPGEPDLLRDVFVSSYTNWRQPLKPPAIERAVNVLQLPVHWWFMVPASVAAAVTSILVSALGLRSLWVLVPVWSLVIAVTFFAARALRRRARLTGSHPVTPATQTDDRFRLRLFVSPKGTTSVDPLTDEMFEPVAIPIPFVLPDRKAWAICAWVVLMLALIGAGWWGKARVLHLGMSFNTLDSWAMMALSSAPFAWLWPTYLRVSPGRLDIMRYGVLGMGIPRLRTIDLRTATITCNLPGKVITIKEADGATLQIPLTDAMPRSTARTILEAARWTGSWSQLPDDALVG